MTMSIFNTQWTTSFVILSATVVSALIIKWFFQALTSPLNQYPGPFFAKWTNLWRFFVVRAGNSHITIRGLHQKYGPIVRLGPDILDLDYPELIKTLYGTDGKYLKTDFYHNNSILMNNKIIYNLFSTTDPKEHAIMKRPIGKYYSSSNVLSVEPLINRAARDLCGYLDERFVKANKPCDLGAYIAYCAWDMVGAATFSENYGYMEKGCDFDGTIEIADRSLDYFVAVGQMPFLDRWLDKNPVVRIGPPNLGSATKIALDHILARATGNDLNFNPQTPDFLDRFFEAKQQHPDTVHDGTILNYVFINLIAGADTTAIIIRAVMYFVLKHREVHRKLVEEILAADFGEVAQYSTARSLPYLEACVRETTRVHPGVAMNLERYVPDSGLTLPNDKFVPAGTKVGINPYVVHRNPGVWGEDVDDFRPERWLQQAGESDDAFTERLKLFNNSDLTFGGGSRICLGRHLGMLEVYKIIGTLFARYEIKLTDQDEEWRVTNSWFLRQKGLICKLKQRF